MAAIAVMVVVGSAVARLWAAAPIRPDRRIAASIVTTLAAPPDQPMHMPTDVAVDRSGQVYVADGANDRVIRFAPEGAIDAVVTAPGGRQLSRPVGITVDSRDQLWIADSGNHRVLVVLEDGELIETIDLSAMPGGRAPDPTDLVVTADGARSYIVDNDNHRILVRDNESGRMTSLGCQGRAAGQFRWPFMICLDAEGYAYVSDVIGARVQRISPSDEPAGQISRWGVQIGQLYRPKGVAVDRHGRLYVSDSTLGVVQVFDSEGQSHGVLTDEQGLPLRFAHPMGMCFDAAGRLYVVELRANRVAVVSVRGGGATAGPQPADAANKRAEE